MEKKRLILAIILFVMAVFILIYPIYSFLIIQNSLDVFSLIWSLLFIISGVIILLNKKWSKRFILILLGAYILFNSLLLLFFIAYLPAIISEIFVALGTISIKEYPQILLGFSQMVVIFLSITAFILTFFVFKSKKKIKSKSFINKF